ncbi:ZIP metal ion transporter family protein [Medicago truncatula]|uniref:ZIP metal ion transporter family protein n=1 Tax=Medicago truncatula TaxID=3880 RepID=A0A072UZH0_MEDTR|nr:ZIP metal ion transporter family protein [Medicago truncatula]
MVLSCAAFSFIFHIYQQGAREIFYKEAFAGVILATGFIHVLPDAFENLTSPCLKEHPWGDFPFTGFVADFPFTGFVAMCTAFFLLFEHINHKNPHGSAHSHKTGLNAGITLPRSGIQTPIPLATSIDTKAAIL